MQGFNESIMQKLISIDFKADFGFFRKPDANNTINLSYNMMHKPALLGILGAIIGLEGFKERGKIPQYYEQLKYVKIGIEPLEHEKGIYQKTTIKYTNTVGYANNGSNYLTEESTLIKPSYRIYLLLEQENKFEQKLYDYLKNGKAEYLPYFGKNEFYAWWSVESFNEHIYELLFDEGKSKTIKTLFLKPSLLKDGKEDIPFDIFNFEKQETPYFYFERLPTGFDEKLMQYEIGNYVFGTYNLKSNIQLDNLFYLENSDSYVQLF